MSSCERLRITQEQSLTGPLLSVLVELEAAAFGIGGMNQWFLPAFARHGAVFVLWYGDRPVGVAQCMRDWSDPDAAYLFGFSLAEDVRGRGWGTVFLNEICQRVAEKGFRRLSLTVAPENSPAVALYRKAGFAVMDMLPDAYGPGNHRYYMVKQFNSQEVRR